MSFIKDRFIGYVLIITLIIILIMAFLHRNIMKGHLPVKRQKTASFPHQYNKHKRYKITRVIDGDTILLNTGETVRLIGIDAPELHHPELPVQRFAKEAKEFLALIAEGFECRLEFEPQIKRDSYGRLLAYVFVDGRCLNEEMIRYGYAYVYTRFPYKRINDFLRLEKQARKAQRGLWSFSLKDARIANLIARYESLSLEGRKRLDELLDELIKKYPLEQKR